MLNTIVFTDIKAFHPHNSIRHGLLLVPFYRWRNGGPPEVKYVGLAGSQNSNPGSLLCALDYYMLLTTTPIQVVDRFMSGQKQLKENEGGTRETLSPQQLTLPHQRRCKRHFLILPSISPKRGICLPYFRRRLMFWRFSSVCRSQALPCFVTMPGHCAKEAGFLFSWVNKTWFQIQGFLIFHSRGFHLRLKNVLAIRGS